MGATHDGKRCELRHFDMKSFTVSDPFQTAEGVNATK